VSHKKKGARLNDNSFNQPHTHETKGIFLLHSQKRRGLIGIQTLQHLTVGERSSAVITLLWCLLLTALSTDSGRE